MCVNGRSGEKDFIEAREVGFTIFCSLCEVVWFGIRQYIKLDCGVWKSRLVSVFVCVLGRGWRLGLATNHQLNTLTGYNFGFSWIRSNTNKETSQGLAIHCKTTSFVGFVYCNKVRMLKSAA